MKKVKSLSVLLIVIVLCFSFLSSFSVSAQSYTRVDIPGATTEVRLARESYSAQKTISAETLGLSEKLNVISDICTTSDGKILVVTEKDSRVVRINPDYTLDKEIFVTDEEGNTVKFDGAKGIYGDDEGNIYISDTLNARVLITDADGKIQKILTLPDEKFIPDDFIFQPTTIKKDSQGYMYIGSIGCYYGVLMYAPTGECLGFYGANTVAATALDTLGSLWEKLTSNDTKKSRSAKKLPYSFSDFDFNREDYMVTSTGRTSKLVSTGTGQIKMITHNGSNILYKRQLNGEFASSTTVNFLETIRGSYREAQNLISIAVDNDDYIYALDAINGTVYKYDSECNLMTVFGGGIKVGNQVGIFKNPVAIDLAGEDVLVADAELASITVFQPTEYGRLLVKAQSLYLIGDYEVAADAWQEVLEMDKNCQLAYRGIAMAEYSRGNYDEAIEAAKIASDSSIYDLAYQKKVSIFVNKNFVWITLILVLVIALVVYGIIKLKKNKRELITNKKVKLLLQFPFHPYATFEEIKYKKLGSVKIAIVITALFYVSSVLNVTSVGFLYSTTLLKNYNALFTLAASIGIILLWSVCNWLVCSIFSGKGTFSEVYVATTYSLVPMVIFNFVKVILTHFVPLSAAGIIAGLGTAIVIFTFFLLSISMIITHEYDFFKFLLTGIVAIFFMILIVFVIFMIAILATQFVSFIDSIFTEIAYR